MESHIFNTRGHELRQKDFSFDKTALFLRGINWPVYAKYWIDEINENNNKHYINKHNSSWIGDFEQIPYDYSVKAEIKMPPGKYLCWVDDIERFYNPMEDYPDLFLRFASLGKSDDTVSDDEVLGFISKFGCIKHSQWLLIPDNYKTTVSFGQFSLISFYEYSREAYLALILYNAYVSKDIKRIKETMSLIDKKLNFFREHGFLFEWPKERLMLDLLRTRWRNHLSKELLKAINSWEKKVGERDNYFTVTRNDSSEVYDNLGHWDHIYAIWDIALIEGPNEAFLTIAGDMITQVVNRRMGHIKPLIKYNYEYSPSDNSNPFNPRFTADSLLDIIWLQFYLKITGQTEANYKICPICNEPIVDPGKRIYHDTCRKAAYAKSRRQAEKLWSEGKALDEIIKITGGNPKTVQSWINKLNLNNTDGG